jgi:hypothetical protein
LPLVGFWFHIYEEQAQGGRPLIFGDVLFFQIESVVLKNVYCANFTGDGIYALSNIFSTIRWLSGKVNKTRQILCPPLSADNQTTKKGAGNVTLSILELCGILKVDAESTNISLGNDIFNRWLILAGDGI